MSHFVSATNRDAHSTRQTPHWLDPSLAGLGHPHIVNHMMQRESRLGRGLARPRTSDSRVEYHVIRYVEEGCGLVSLASESLPRLACICGKVYIL